jgi:hypothetical protein
LLIVTAQGVWYAAPAIDGEIVVSASGGGMGTQGRISKRARSLALMLALMLAIFLPGSFAGLVVAALAAVEPAAILLVPEDLPPGFVVDPQSTSTFQMASVGPASQVKYLRESTPENLGSGPVVIEQLVVRLEGRVGAGEALVIARRRLSDGRGLVPSDAGPNDEGTITLQKVEGDIQHFAVGFIKENMIIITIAGGLPDIVTPSGVLQIAGISSAKLDAALGR